MEINNEESIYYWAAKNKIPVFSPAITDGSLGDMLFFHSYKNPGLIVDILQGMKSHVLKHFRERRSRRKRSCVFRSDLRRLTTLTMKAAHSGMIIVGGGLIKHHICNANMMVRKNRKNRLLMTGAEK